MTCGDDVSHAKKTADLFEIKISMIPKGLSKSLRTGWGGGLCRILNLLLFGPDRGGLLQIEDLTK